MTIVTESDAIAQLCNLWRPDDDPAETISKNEVMANARLIAAAPEMLGALRVIHANAGESPEWIRNRIDAVIAKAEGRGEP